MEEKILEVREITKRYPGVVALDRLSFDLEKGEVHAIVGENGAGKSTLIKCLCGAVVPEEGTITIEGKDYSEMNPALSRSLGIEVVYQELNLIDGLTVAENVCFGAKYGKLVNFRLLEEKTKKDAIETDGKEEKTDVQSTPETVTEESLPEPDETRGAENNEKD